jgi:hypothetical protein
MGQQQGTVSTITRSSQHRPDLVDRLVITADIAPPMKLFSTG